MNFRKSFPLLTPVLVILATILLTGRESDLIAWDQLQYMSIAKQITMGHGMADINGNVNYCRPGYLLMLALLGSFFKITAVRMVLINNLIFSLLVLSIFYFTINLYNKRTAIFTLLLFLTDPGISLWGHINLDATWPLFLILSLLLLLTENDRHDDLLLGIMAGLATGFAFLVKEWAILFIPMPLIMFILKMSDIRMKRIAAFYISACLPIIIWLYYSVFVAHFGIQGMWGGLDYTQTLAAVAGEQTFTQSLLNVIKYFLKGTIEFIYQPVPKHDTFAINRILISPVVYLAILWSIWKAIRHYDRSAILLTVILIFMPFSAIVSNYQYRYQQNLISISFLYILTASLIDTFLGFIVAKNYSYFKENPKRLRLIYICLILLSVFPIFTSRNLKYRAIFVGSLLKGQTTQAHYCCSVTVNQLNDILKPDETVLIYDRLFSLNRGLFLFGGPYKMMNLPIKAYDLIPPDGKVSVGAVAWSVPRAMPDEILMLDEEELYKILEKKNISTIVIEDDMHPLASWIKLHLNIANQQYDAEEGYQIFHLDKKNPIKEASDGPLFIGICAKDRLDQIRTENRPKYNAIVQLLFSKEHKSMDLSSEFYLKETNAPCVYSGFIFVD